jgi:hypothetical protein
VTLTARLFVVLRHGSPKVPFDAGTVHAERPTQSDSTAETELAALQLPAEKLPHVPVGLP